LIISMVISIISLAWLPWQQSAPGAGRVVAYKPGERQQEITAPVKGVVYKVPENLVEGAFVREGDLLLEIKPTAADLAGQLDGQLANLTTKLETGRIKAQSYGENVKAYITARDAAIEAGQQNVIAAQAKLDAKTQLIPGYEAKLKQAEANFQRQLNLNRSELTSTKDLEYREVDRDFAKAELESVRREVDQAEAELASKEAELDQKQSEAQAKIDSARADQQAALGEMATVEKEIRDLQLKKSELDRLDIRAPRDGYIQRLPVFVGGQSVKEGDYLLTFVPETDDHAVELLVRGNDMPLVHTGDHVRLQFEGWPALQFTGWPSVAIGTFGGEVALVDPSDDGSGRFRVMVRPAPGEDWPNERYLRQGVRANGWIMLREVSLAYEIWRQLNGFPPVLSEDPMSKDGKDAAKRPKIPKT
jgi:multidrug resistance efflux pump